MRFFAFCAVIMLAGTGVRAADLTPSDVMHLKVAELENTVKELTDRVEILTHKVGQYEAQLEKINADNDLRFQEIQKNLEKPANTVKAVEPVAPVAAVKSGEDPKTLYSRGVEEIRAGKYVDAQKTLTSFLASYPEDALAGNAKYWLGETFYARGDFEAAAVHFAEGFQSYPKNQKAPDNLLKLGLSMQALKKNKEACTAFKSLQKQYPDAEASIMSKAKAEAKKLSCK